MLPPADIPDEDDKARSEKEDARMSVIVKEIQAELEQAEDDEDFID